MDIISFVVTIIVLTASGAIEPGTLFFTTITHDLKHGAKSGFIFSFAHSIVEFSLIMFFALGLLTITSETIVKTVIGFIGGIVLIAFGAVKIRISIISKSDELKKTRFVISTFILHWPCIY
jgi:threonine/homoserine/homoserine lactone efflux protein